MNVAIIGSGYVGLVTGACLAKIGHRVLCVDSDTAKVAALRKGTIPIYEPGLQELIRESTRKKKLRFGSDMKTAVRESEIIFIAVGTPSLENGEADLTGIENVARHIAVNLKTYRLIVEKSTVPVETGEWVKKTVSTYLRGKQIPFDVASNPEFLREGSAIQDFMHPDRIVIGVESARARQLLEELYRPLKAPMVVTDIKSAELIKHASNSFLATKISFINAVCRICDTVGADIKEVANGMGLDKRIGPAFLNAGIGYGGSCFPKDLDAFITIAARLGYDFKLLRAVRDINNQQVELFLQKIKSNLWVLKEKTFAVLGLSFKPDTDDLRNAPALEVIRLLLAEGARVRVFDPCAMGKAKALFKARLPVVFCKDAYDAARGSDCLLLLTEWSVFRKLDFKRLKKLLNRPLVIDARNMFEPPELPSLGFSYVGMGRRPGAGRKA